MNEQFPSRDTEAPADNVLRRHWLMVCLDSDIRATPLARTVLGYPLVLFRDGRTVVALSDRCPHRNAPLSAGRVIDGCIQCPYHGWRYSADGRCTFRPGVADAVPRETAVESFATVVQDGAVWVYLGDRPTTPPPHRPWYDDSAFEYFRWSDTVEASFADALENLLDGTHTPFVHSGLVRSPSEPQLFTAIVRVQGGIAEAEYIGEGRQAGWISRLFERDRRTSFGRFIPPCVAELEYTSTGGTEFILNSHFTPECDNRLRVHSTIFLRRSTIPLFVKRWLITPFFRRVLRQDQGILKLQQDNIRRHHGRAFQSWEGDLLRGWIDTWLRTGQLPDSGMERRVELKL